MASVIWTKKNSVSSVERPMVVAGGIATFDSRYGPWPLAGQGLCHRSAQADLRARASLGHSFGTKTMNSLAPAPLDIPDHASGGQGGSVRSTTTTEGPRGHRSPPAEVGLRLLTGRRGGPVVTLGARMTIGRAEGVDLWIDDPSVSRRHAKVIRRATGEFFLLDLGSKNRTLLNAIPIEMSRLRPGDLIGVADHELRFDHLDEFELSLARERAAPRIDSWPLSEREHEVARLLGEGLTNAQIGRRLGIQRSTVTTHLARIYQRLDIHSRAELVRLMSRYDPW